MVFIGFITFTVVLTWHPPFKELRFQKCEARSLLAGGLKHKQVLFFFQVLRNSCLNNVRHMFSKSRSPLEAPLPLMTRENHDFVPLMAGCS